MKRFLILSVMVLMFLSCATSRAPARSVIPVLMEKANILNGKLIRVYDDDGRGKYGFFKVFDSLSSKTIFYTCPILETAVNIDFKNLKAVSQIANVNQCVKCRDGNCENSIYDKTCTVTWKQGEVKMMRGPTQKSGYLPNTNHQSYSVCIDDYYQECPVFERCRHGDYEAQNAEEYFKECVNLCQCRVIGMGTCY